MPDGMESYLWAAAGFACVGGGIAFLIWLSGEIGEKQPAAAEPRPEARTPALV